MSWNSQDALRAPLLAYLQKKTWWLDGSPFHGETTWTVSFDASVQMFEITHWGLRSSAGTRRARMRRGLIELPVGRSRLRPAAVLGAHRQISGYEQAIEVYPDKQHHFTGVFAGIESPDIVVSICPGGTREPVLEAALRQLHGGQHDIPVWHDFGIAQKGFPLRVYCHNSTGVSRFIYLSFLGDPVCPSIPILGQWKVDIRSAMLWAMLCADHPHEGPLVTPEDPFHYGRCLLDGHSRIDEAHPDLRVLGDYYQVRGRNLGQLLADWLTEPLDSRHDEALILAAAEVL